MALSTEPTLTEQEYRALSQSISLPAGAFINGKACSAISGDTFESINPANNQIVGSIAACNSDDVDLAVLKAREAFESGIWAKLHPSERKQAVDQTLQVDQA